MERLEKLLEDMAAEYSADLPDEEKTHLIDKLEQVANIHCKVMTTEAQTAKVAMDHEEKLEQIRLNSAIQESKEIREDRQAEHDMEKENEELKNDRKKINNERFNITAESLCKIIGAAGTSIVAVMGLMNTRDIFEQVVRDDREGRLYISTGFDMFRNLFGRGKM